VNNTVGSDYWEREWDRIAREKADARCISGWGEIPFEEMLHAINRVAGLLDLGPEDRLLDLGCGAGIFEMAYSRSAREIYGLDLSREMVRVAGRNCRPYGNVLIARGDLLHLPFPDGSFRKILVNSAIQYLGDRDRVRAAVREISRVAAAGGRILISLVPDADTRQDLLEGYDRLGLPPAEARRKKEAHGQVLWFRRGELIRMLREAGAATVTTLKPLNDFQGRYYFDLLVTRG
jgi:SAM-dependent methyltransferase